MSYHNCISRHLLLRHWRLAVNRTLFIIKCIAYTWRRGNFVVLLLPFTFFRVTVLLFSQYNANVKALTRDKKSKGRTAEWNSSWGWKDQLLFFVTKSSYNILWFRDTWIFRREGLSATHMLQGWPQNDKAYCIAALVEAGVRHNKRLALVMVFKMISLLVVQVLCGGLETTLN
jgi:hypothetical protein